MVSKTHLLAFFIVFSGLIVGQKHYYDLIPKVPENYFFDSQQTYNKYVTTKDSALKEKDIKDYAEGLAYYHKATLQSGMVYFNWTEIEDYLKKIVTKIKEANNITKELKVFLIRNEDNNATASDNGIVYVYIGLLANTPDEASLVSVLGHEISHALNNDQRKSYQFENKNKKKNLKSVLSMSHGNRAFEARADDFGFKVATDLGYDISSEYNAIIKFESDFRWYKSQYSYEDPKWLIYIDGFDKENSVAADSLENLLSSHPNNFKRIEALKNFTSKKNGQKKFIISEELFASIKQKAKIEQLYINFSEGDYLDCIKNAFYYHLSDQKNADYIYYLSESLRRLLQYNPKLSRKGFLTNESKDVVFEKNKGILHDISYISLDTSFIAMVAKDSVYGKYNMPFETYLQAYNFFIKKGIELNTKDINLTAGLFNVTEKNIEKAKLSFKKHLETANSVHQEFTTAFLADNLFSGFENHKTNLVYIGQPNYFYRSNGTAEYSFIESINSTLKVKEMFTELLKIKTPNTELLFEDELDIVENNTYTNLLAHLHSYKTEKEAENDYIGVKSFLDNDYWRNREYQNPKDVEVLEKQKNFFYLNPEHWKFFKEKTVSSITKIVPYLYNVKTPRGNRTYFYLELSYFDPFNKKYVYFEQEYLEYFTKDNIKKVLKKFSEKVNFKAN